MSQDIDFHLLSRKLIIRTSFLPFSQKKNRTS